jgi:AcrR family transcriptional regulator
MTESDVQPISRPGGRTARTRAAVCDATLAELAAHGYAGLTVEGVAARSGVHKTTVYRRWGGVDGLVVDVLALADEDDWRPPDTGTLEGDLVGLVRAVAATFGDPAEAAAPTAFVAAAFQSARAAAALHAFFAERHRRSAAVVTRAIARGEVPAGTDADAVVTAAVAPFYYRVLLAGESPTAVPVEQSAAAVAHAARAGVYAGGKAH